MARYHHPPHQSIPEKTKSAAEQERDRCAGIVSEALDGQDDEFVLAILRRIVNQIRNSPAEYDDEPAKPRFAFYWRIGGLICLCVAIVVGAIILRNQRPLVLDGEPITATQVEFLRGIRKYKRPTENAARNPAAIAQRAQELLQQGRQNAMDRKQSERQFVSSEP